MSVKRYDCTNGGSQHCYGCYTMDEVEDGDYVRSDDYDKLLDNSTSVWQPIGTAPRDGKTVLLYRPLAYKTGDPAIASGETYKESRSCLAETIPKGALGINFTSRACFATHWMPLPAPPTS